MGRTGAVSVDGTPSLIRFSGATNQHPEPKYMRGLTLCQPWAQLMAFGEKTIETRSWKTDYVGPVAIHAAKGLGGLAEMVEWSPRENDLENVVASFPFSYRLRRHIGPIDFEALARWLPRGEIVAVGNLVGCWETTDLGLKARMADPSRVGPYEESFGNYRPGRWAWVFDDVFRVNGVSLVLYDAVGNPYAAEAEEPVPLGPSVVWPGRGYRQGLWMVHGMLEDSLASALFFHYGERARGMPVTRASVPRGGVAEDVIGRWRERTGLSWR